MQQPQFGPPPDPNGPAMTAVPARKTHQFEIKHTFDDGVSREGTFGCKKLSIKETAAVAVRKTQLNGGFHYDENNPGQGIDEDTDWTNRMIAHLEIALIQRPFWFNLDELDDVDLLLKVFTEVAKFESSFLSPHRRAAVGSGSSPADSSGESKEPGAAGSVAAVGGGQVPASLDP